LQVEEEKLLCRFVQRLTPKMKTSPTWVVITISGLFLIPAIQLPAEPPSQSEPPAQSSGDGSGNAARFYRPQGVAVDGSGNVYVADSGNHTIRKITPGGVMTTLAGSAYQEQ
jgi:hypothetical protein